MVKDYKRASLRLHPDKGGDPETYAIFQSAFQAWKICYDQYAIIKSRIYVYALTSKLPYQTSEVPLMSPRHVTDWTQ